MATDRLINKDQGDQIITKLEAIKTAMQTQTDGIVSDAFNENASYYAGDYCINNDTLYKFTSDHSGAWDLADVTATNVGDELASLKSALSNQGKVGRKNVTLTFENGWSSSMTNTSLGIPSNAEAFAFISSSNKWVVWRKTSDGLLYIALAIGTSSGSVVADFTGTIEGDVYYHYY